MTNKLKTTIVGTILAASVGVGYIGTGGGVVNLKIVDKSHWLTQNQYEQVKNEIVLKYLEKKELKDKFAAKEISLFELLYVDTQEMKIYREIINEKKKTIKNINKKNLLRKIVEEATK
jgi:hypothetical protein